MVLSRFFSSLGAVVVAGTMVAACSSAPVDTSEPTGEALSRFATCPSWGCAPVCYDDPTCFTTPTTWATVGAPFLGASSTAIAEGQALKSEMIAAGCTTPFLYSPCRNGSTLANKLCTNITTWPVSSCPIDVSAGVHALAESGCDQCTGRALPGRFLVTWSTGGELPGGCHSPQKCNI